MAVDDFFHVDPQQMYPASGMSPSKAAHIIQPNTGSHPSAHIIQPNTGSHPSEQTSQMHRSQTCAMELNFNVNLRISASRSGADDQPIAQHTSLPVVTSANFPEMAIGSSEVSTQGNSQCPPIDNFYTANYSPRRPSASIVDEFFDAGKTVDKAKASGDIVTDLTCLVASSAEPPTIPATAEMSIASSNNPAQNSKPKYSFQNIRPNDLNSNLMNKYVDQEFSPEDIAETLRTLECIQPNVCPRSNLIPAPNVGNSVSPYPSPTSDGEALMFGADESKLIPSLFDPDNTLTATSVAHALCGSLSDGNLHASYTSEQTNVVIKAEAEEAERYMQAATTQQMAPSLDDNCNILERIKIEPYQEKPSCQFQGRFILPRPERGSVLASKRFSYMHKQKITRRTASLGQNSSTSQMSPRPMQTNMSGNASLSSGGIMLSNSQMVDANTTFSGVRVTSNPSIPVAVTQTSSGVQLVSQPAMLPLTPPRSVPSSPENHMGSRHTPPPPYPGHLGIVSTPGTTIVNMTTPDGSSVPVAIPVTPVTGRPRVTHPGCTTIKYNRRNNPELEKRRVHYCDFPGMVHNIMILIFTNVRDYNQYTI